MPTTARDTPARQKRRILLNATDMLAPSHLNFGQWRRPEDCGASKRRSLSYWTDLAKTLERGDITALILDDVFGQNDTHGANSEPAIRTGCQFPIGDPTIPVAAMAAVTKSISFIVTASPFHEAPTITARRFSTIDHLTGGRFGWNVTTQLNASTARSLGLPVIDSEKVHEVASECLDVLYKLWEGSWADDALNEDVGNEIYSDPTRIRWIQHASKSFHINTPHMLDPSPQRTPFLMHTGATAIDFAAKHAEAITLSALSPHTLAPRVIALRHAAARHGRDPRCLKIFAMLAPILGSTDAEAQAKFARAMGFTSIEGGLVFYSSVTGVNFSQLSLDNETRGGGNNDVFVGGTSRTPKWTPQNLGKLMAVGGNGAVAVGSAQRVADTMEEWVQIADIDGFNISAVVTPGSFEDVVDLLVPELQLRGLYPKRQENGTLRERVYGMGQKYLRNDHYGSTLKFTDS
ncbi:Dimethyl-sulfide monooxygenase [Ceratocystis lukuohia]|uniref:Dimethyl-sulfide monooxygenase n=1 Tax=Ceratocystis lukuohia TaxID=2019550 RepID=A0ABR4MMQ0_9PEZI